MEDFAMISTASTVQYFGLEATVIAQMETCVTADGWLVPEASNLAQYLT